MCMGAGGWDALGRPYGTRPGTLHKEWAMLAELVTNELILSFGWDSRIVSAGYLRHHLYRNQTMGMVLSGTSPDVDVLVMHSGCVHSFFEDI
jgi:hypothetical protein